MSKFEVFMIGVCVGCYLGILSFGVATLISIKGKEMLENRRKFKELT